MISDEVDSVNAALREIAERRLRMSVVDILDGNEDFHNPEVMAGAWR